MVMHRLGGVLVAGSDPPRHAEMQQQEAGLVELDQDVLAAPRQPADQRPGEPLGQHRRERPTQIRAAQFGAHDAPAGHAQRQAAADGFDFGKLRHLI